MKRYFDCATAVGRFTTVPMVILVLALVPMGCGGGKPISTAPGATYAAPEVTTFTPTTAAVGIATTFLVTGSNLPSTVAVTLSGGSCASPTNVTATSFSVLCTPGTGEGAKTMVARTNLETQGGWWIGQQTLMVTLPTLAPVGALADTGITINQCWGTGSDTLVSCTSASAVALNDKQDGMLGRDASNPDNTDGLLGSAYRLVGALGSSDCVRDEITGRTWQRASLPLSALSGDALNQQAAALRDAANAAATCGYTDWVIPSPADLHNLVNYGISGTAAMDGNWFTAKRAWYYTATQFLGGTSNSVWLVDFARGQVNSIGALSGSAELRLMRAVPAAANRYSYSADGAEVTDTQTGLIWQRCSVGQIWSNSSLACTGGTSVYAHADALAYAKTLSPWRLPNVKELASLVNTNKVLPAIDPIVFPNLPNAAGLGYWSSTPDVQAPAQAWTVEFSQGRVGSSPRSGANFVRLVR